MHVLWLIPDYYSFLQEELTALAPRVGRLSVISQARPVSLPGVNSVTISRDRLTPNRLAARISNIALFAAAGGGILRPSDWPKLRRLARHNEVIAEFVRRESVDVIHSHFAHPEGTAGWQSACGRPVVLTLRGVDILTLPNIGYGFMLERYYAKNLRKAIRRVQAVTVASRQSWKAARSLGVAEDKLLLVPNGVDLERFTTSGRASERAALRSELGVGGSRLVVAAGNLVAGKAFDRLIRATHAVVESISPVKLVILGEGPERRRLQQLIAQLNISDRVTLVGRVARDLMPRYLAACDLFVHPSLSEGFGNVVLEAMASGCPVVVTSTGAAADLIRSGQNGVLVPVDDAPSLAREIERLLNNCELRRRMGEAAKATVIQESLSIQDRIGAFTAIYEGVCRPEAAELAR